MKRSQLSPMALGTLLSSFATMAGCEPGPVSPPPPASYGVARLDVTPGCHQPFVTGGPCETDVCKKARARNAERQQELEQTVAPFAAAIDRVLDDPSAPTWFAAWSWPKPDQVVSVVSVAPLAEGEDAGLLQLDVHSKGTLSTSLEVDQIARVFLAYTPSSSILDLGSGVVRWSPHAIAFNEIYRGCDPETQISFDARTDDKGNYGLVCWDRAGNPVDCQTVNLWPQ